MQKYLCPGKPFSWRSFISLNTLWSLRSLKEWIVWQCILKRSSYRITDKIIPNLQESQVPQRQEDQEDQVGLGNQHDPVIQVSKFSKRNHRKADTNYSQLHLPLVPEVQYLFHPEVQVGQVIHVLPVNTCVATTENYTGNDLLQIDHVFIGEQFLPANKKCCVFCMPNWARQAYIQISTVFIFAQI